MTIENNDLPDDFFLRRAVAQKLVTLLYSDIDVSPMLITGGWGSGKTTLIKRLEKILSESHCDDNFIYINAYQEDHNDNSLITLIGAVANLLPNDKKASLIEKSIPVIKYGLKEISKASISWVMKKEFSDIDDGFQKAVQNAGEKATDYSIEKIIKEQSDSIENINNLKTILNDVSKGSRIIITIDELDRCKPSFAINLIENIKYIFDMDNINFILVANSEQLERSISHRYGASDSPKGYLDKFIKFTMEIPSSFGDESQRKNAASHYFMEKIKEKKILSIASYEHLLQEICCLISDSGISLREVETYIRNIEVYNRLSSEKISDKKDYLFNLLRMSFIFIHCFSYKRNILINDIMKDKKIIEKLPSFNRPYSFREASNLQMIGFILSSCEFDEYGRNYKIPEGLDVDDGERSEIQYKIMQLSPPSNRLGTDFFKIMKSVQSTLSFS